MSWDGALMDQTYGRLICSQAAFGTSPQSARRLTKLKSAGTMNEKG